MDHDKKPGPPVPPKNAATFFRKQRSTDEDRRSFRKGKYPAPRNAAQFRVLGGSPARRILAAIFRYQVHVNVPQVRSNGKPAVGNPYPVLALDGLQRPKETEKANKRISLPAHSVGSRGGVARDFVDGLAKDSPPSSDAKCADSRESGVEKERYHQDEDEIPHHNVY